MAKIERIYVVPLRKEFLKSPKYRRAKKAITALRQFLVRHMKSEDIYIGKFLNEAIWQRGIRNPPHHVKINVAKDETGRVVAELFGKEMPKFEEEEKKDKKKKKTEEKKEEAKEEQPAEKKEEVKAEKAKPAKKPKKEEIKEAE